MANQIIHAYKWFYTNPGTNAGEINERVLNTFWSAGLGNVWLETVQAEAPYRMEGYSSGQAIAITWQPGEQFALSTQTDQPKLTESLSFILGFKPSLKFSDSDKITHYEWRLKNHDERWRELSGNPSYQNLERL